MVSNVFHQNKCFITFIRFYWVFVFITSLSFSLLTWPLSCSKALLSILDQAWVMIFNMRKFSQGKFRRHTFNFQNSLVYYQILGSWAVNMWMEKIFCLWFPVWNPGISEQWTLNSTPPHSQLHLHWFWQHCDHTNNCDTNNCTDTTATPTSHTSQATFVISGTTKASYSYYTRAIVVTTHLFDNRDGTDRFVHAPPRLLFPPYAKLHLAPWWVYCQAYQPGQAVIRRSNGTQTRKNALILIFNILVKI